MVRADNRGPGNVNMTMLTSNKDIPSKIVHETQGQMRLNIVEAMGKHLNAPALAETFESLRAGDQPPIPTADVMYTWPQEEPIDVQDDTFMKYGYRAQPWLDLSACHVFSMVLRECKNCLLYTSPSPRD